MKTGFVIGGLALAGITTVAAEFLPGAPAAIQGNPVLQPIGTFLINQQTILTIIGLLMIVLGLFL